MAADQDRLDPVFEAVRVGDVGKAMAIYRRLTGARLSHAREYIESLIAALPAGDRLNPELLDAAFAVIREHTPLAARVELERAFPQLPAEPRDAALRHAADLACRAFELWDRVRTGVLEEEQVPAALRESCPGFSEEGYRAAIEYGRSATAGGQSGS